MRRLTVPLLAVVVLFIGIVAVSGRPAVVAQEATPTSDLEANKALASRFHEDLFDQGNQAAAAEILAPDFVWHAPPQEIFVTGPEAVNTVAADLRAFIPDFVLTEDDVIAEGDRVVIRWTLTGTAQTESGGVPVIYTGIDIFRIENGQLAELWQNTADLELEEQLAAAATAGTPMAGTPAAEAEETVAVSLTEFAIDMPTDLAAGLITFQVTNDGTTDHNFEVEGQGIEEELPQNLAPGQSGTLSLDLAPGTYEVYCPVGNHADEGMRLELTVTE